MPAGIKLVTPAWTGLIRRIRGETAGLAMLEFAFAAPLVLTVGLYGIELSNVAIVNLRVSQVALELADNASRVGLNSGAATVQLREVDLNDVLLGAKAQGASIGVTKNARIILSSLETFGGTQRIHWQRCIGLKSGTGYDSSYGTTLPTDGIDTDTGTADNAASHPGTLAPTGMGDTGSKIIAPPDSGVMFVEINYSYKPIISAWLTAPRRIHYTASYIVRDRRDFTEIYNPSPEDTRSTCDKYTE